MLVCYWQETDILAVTLILNSVPLALLIIDWCLNRMYLSVVVSLFYPAVCYVFYLSYQALTNSPNISFNVPEFNEFFKDVEPQALAIALPSIAAAWAYIMTRVKFAFFDEGDLE